MKKLLGILAVIIVLGTSACQKTYEQYYTTPNKTIYASINTSDWGTSDGGFTYSTSITLFPDDNYYNEFDGILAYVSYNNGTTYEQIPQTFEGIAFSFTTTNNSIVVNIQTAENTVAVNPPGSIKMKVVLIPSE